MSDSITTLSNPASSLMYSPYLGESPTSRQEVAQVPTPPPMGPQHRPLPFADLIDVTTEALADVGLKILDEAFALAAPDPRGNPMRLFGLMDVAPRGALPSLLDTRPDWALSLGLRASHDQTVARGLVAGSRVFVCSNLCFSGAVRINVKHTTYADQRIRGAIYQAIETLPHAFEVQTARTDAWQATPLKPRWGDAALTECLRRGILNASQLPAAIAAWDDPSQLTLPQQEEVAATATDANGILQRSVWTFSNAVTGAMRPPLSVPEGAPEGTPARAHRIALPAATERTMRLSRFLDEIAGFEA